MVPHCGFDLHFSDNEWKHLTFIGLEAKKYKIKVPADSVFGENLVPGSQIAFLLHPHIGKGPRNSPGSLI